MAREKPQLNDLLPGRVDVGESPGGPRRRFTILGALAAAVALGSQLFDRIGFDGDWGFTLAMVIAGIVALAMVAPWRFMVEEKTPADVSDWKIGQNLDAETPITGPDRDLT